jgi:hypothetical protein
MASVIILLISLFTLALILRLVFVLRKAGEAVEIDLRDIEESYSETVTLDANSSSALE